VKYKLLITLLPQRGCRTKNDVWQLFLDCVEKF
jgi:hypothetical protein